jgi:cAMP phosphodiesterase
MLPQKANKSHPGHDERLNMPEIGKKDQQRSQWELQCYRKKQKRAIPVTMEGSMCPKSRRKINFGHNMSSSMLPLKEKKSNNGHDKKFIVPEIGRKDQPRSPKTERTVTKKTL